MARINGTGAGTNGGTNGGTDGNATLQPGYSELGVPTGDVRSIDFSIFAPTLTTPITLSVAPLPVGVTASFSPAVLYSKRSKFTLTLAAADNAPVSDQPVLVSVIAAGQNQAKATAQVALSVTLQFTLDVEAAGDVALATENSVQIGPYQKLTIPVRIKIAEGVGAARIALSMKTPLPAGVIAQFDPAVLRAPANGGSLLASLLLSTPPPANLLPGMTATTLAANIGANERSNYTFPLVVVLAQLQWFTCTVNQVGPAADGAGAETAIPVIYVNLSDSSDSFSSCWFFAAEQSRREMLAVALAALNTGRTVSVCVQTPNPGNDPYTPCYRMYVNAS